MDGLKPFDELLKYWKKIYDQAPVDLENKTIDRLPADDWAEILRAYRVDRDDFGLLLMGETGVGKTFTLMTVLNNALITAYKNDFRLTETVAYYPVGFLIHQLRASPNGAEYHRCLINHYLFLDDLGVEKTSDWVCEQFFTILDSRCQRKLLTYISTNLTMKEIGEKYGERFVSRLKEMCLPVIITGTDRRVIPMKNRIEQIKSRLPYKDDEPEGA